MACAQALLWFGIKRSKRAPTKMHPYGYMRDKFVFSLISAVGIFCLGAGVSVWNGVSGLLAATPVEHVGWSIAGTRRLVPCELGFQRDYVKVQTAGRCFAVAGNASYQHRISDVQPSCCAALTR